MSQRAVLVHGPQLVCSIFHLARATQTCLYFLANGGASTSHEASATPDPNGREEGEEEEEVMDVENEDDAMMRAMMGFSGFDSTKVSHI